MYASLKKWFGISKPPLLKQQTAPVAPSLLEDKTNNEKSYGELLCYSFLSGTEAIEIIRDSLLQSSQNLMQEVARLEELTLKNQQAHSGMEKLVDLVNLIEEHSEESISYIKELMVVIQEITENIKDINKFSRQTNLLAINSAIEAAHTGPRGAGFSVIAREIKMLSSEIHHQATNITTLTQAINQHAQSVNTNIALNDELTRDIRIATEQACLMLQQVIESSTYMQKIIYFIANQQFLNTVKLDHVIWKGKLYELILNKDKTTAVNSHAECRLGKWYYSEAGRAFSHFSSFTQLDIPHAEVHSSGQLALKAFREQDDQKLWRNLEKMERASTQVIKKIDELLAQMQPS